MTRDEKIFKLCKEITDRATVMLGVEKIDTNSPEYWGVDAAMKFAENKYGMSAAADALDVALVLKKRKPVTFEVIQKRSKMETARLEKALEVLCDTGLVEYHWENLDGKNPNHEKRWVLDMFVPGSAELMVIHPDMCDEQPVIANFFERMAFLPLAGVTEMVPPGGAGIGMHVVPVEKAIPADCEALDIERLSHWLKKYEGHIGVAVCSCRKQQRIRDEGSGDIEAEWCSGVGDFADYCRETGKGHDIT